MLFRSLEQDFDSSGTTLVLGGAAPHYSLLHSADERTIAVQQDVGLLGHQQLSAILGVQRLGHQGSFLLLVSEMKSQSTYRIQISVNGTEGRWIAPPNTDRSQDQIVLYYLHGGAFVLVSISTSAP